MSSQKSVFKLNDIRGVYPDELNEDIACKIGKSLVKYLGCKNVVVGRDIRLSSEVLFKSLAEGIISNGADVIDLGLVSTDAFYFAVGKFCFDAGVMITASHNPPQYNGFKICTKGAAMLYEGNGLENLRKMLENNDFDVSNTIKGKIIAQDIHDDYLKHSLSFIRVDRIRPLKIAIDASSGMAGLSVEEVAVRLPIQPYFLNIIPDGTFPHHAPNSNDPNALKEVASIILKHKLDFGVIFDGDADRVSFLDETGKFVDAGIILAILIKYFLAVTPNSKIVYDSASSKIVKDAILKYGGLPVRSLIGHSFMKAAMRENNALLGGEHTGHFYFKNNFYSDSGMIAFLIMLELVSATDKTLSEIVKEMNPYFRSEEQNYKREEGYEQQLAQVEKYYLESGVEVERFDGIIINGRGFCIHIHPANTEPLVRTNIEANTPSLLREKEDELRAVFIQAGFK